MNTSAVVPFCFNDHLVRTVTIDDDPWFVAKDVCDVLGYGNPRQALATHLDDDEKGVQNMDTPGGRQEISIISESGLYTLIIRSNKPQAKPFRKWVTAEVLPQIRRTGSYQTPTQDKTIRMRHTVIRGSMNPGGLDIRYTMDLSKIVMRPTKRGLELLERITGLQLADIPTDDKEQASDAQRLFQTFYAERYAFCEGDELLFAAVYGDFVQWCSGAGCRPIDIASRISFSRMVQEIGHEVRKSGGTSRICDIRRTVGEVSK